MATGIEHVVGGFSWQVAGGVWSPDHPFDEDHRVFEIPQRHWGEHAIDVLDTLNAELAKLSADGRASAP
jgi:hypothetical protein